MTKSEAVLGVKESGRFAPTFFHPNTPTKALSFRRSAATEKSIYPIAGMKIEKPASL